MAKTVSAGAKTPDNDSVRELITLCKAGKFFEVQAWIAAGKPVNRPAGDETRGYAPTPLEVAIDTGFHSLVEVLLKAGAKSAPTRPDYPVDVALENKNIDLLNLLADHGYDLSQVSMLTVLSTWGSSMVGYFLDRGASLEDDRPVAAALCSHIRPALGVLKQYRETIPSLQRQANAALRYHCSKGNAKWVALMLWAGADPFAKGSEAFGGDDCDDEENGTSAVVYAALYKHFDLFNQRSLKLPLDNPATNEVLHWAVRSRSGLPLAERLLKSGLNPNDQSNGGCSALQGLLNSLSRWGILDPFGSSPRVCDDPPAARDDLLGVHLLARYGARWIPSSKHDFDMPRRSLCKLIPDYTLQFTWIMARYQACSRESLAELIRTPTITRHIKPLRQQVYEQLARLPSELSGEESGTRTAQT